VGGGGGGGPANRDVSNDGRDIHSTIRDFAPLNPQRKNVFRTIRGQG